MSVSRFVVVLAAVLVLIGTSSAQAAAPASPARADRPVPGPPPRHVVRATDQIVAPASTRRAAATASSAAPFLTRPYWDPHSVTSVFDHCNPDYSLDGRICEEDGTVATRSNGVDPTFNAGYAITPGGTNYLYYDGHNGWDIALSYETLLAAADGVVKLAGCDPYNGGCNAGFGQTVTIDHQNGFTTRYGHMSQIWVSPGQTVHRGDQIGVSGNSGASTGPHLHFGVYITSSWTAIDPWGWEGNYPDPWPSDQGNLWLTGNPQNPVPSAPQSVSATSGSAAGSANVTWSAPGFDGGSGITSYTVTATPGGASVTVPGSQTSAVLNGLTNGVTYTVTVTASNGVGAGPASSPSNQVVPSGTGPRSACTLPSGTCGYAILTSSGGIYSFGSAQYYGNLIDHGYPGPAVSLGEMPSGTGYHILTSSGGLYSFGSAQGHYYGNLIDHDYPGPAVAIGMMPDGNGYQILTASGGLYSFGSATGHYYGNLIDHGYPGNAVGLAMMPDGQGYSILTDSGGLYSFGSAQGHYYGNLLDHNYPGPAVDIAMTRSGKGYSILTGSGGIYSFGDATYFGNLIDHNYPGPAVALGNAP